MCLIILTQPSVKLPTKKELQCAWENNPHGAGYSYFMGTLNIIEKELLNFEVFYAMLKKDYKVYGKFSQFLIHFRYATHGLIDDSNCHPFTMINGPTMAHNGIICEMPEHPTKSDTIVFKEYILEKLPTRFWENESIMILLETFLDGSKIVLIHNAFEFTIINEKLGHWNNGSWFSNDTYEDSYAPYSINRFEQTDFPCDFCGQTIKTFYIEAFESCLCKSCCEYNGVLA
jgi:predicted glutamine amidotransferase